MCNNEGDKACHLEIVDRQGITKHIDAVLCELCASSLNAKEWVTVTLVEPAAPTLHTED